MTDNSKEKMNKFQEKFLSEKAASCLSLMGIVVFVCFVILNLTCGNWHFSLLLNEEKIGQFGDFVGGVVGSLFALVGVILYYVALKEQRKDLKMNQESLKLQTDALNQQVEEFRAQEKEMRETREVYEKQTLLFEKQTQCYETQAQEYRKQTKLLALQQFDSSFYSLLKILSLQKTEFYHKNGEKFASFKASGKNTNALNIAESIVKTEESFCKIFLDVKNCFDGFSQTFLRVLNSINCSEITEEMKSHYVEILKSQLTLDDKIFLYYFYRKQLALNENLLIKKYLDLFYVDSIEKLECDDIKSVEAKDVLSAVFEKMRGVITSGIDFFNSLENEKEEIQKTESFTIGNRNFGYEFLLNDNEVRITFIYDENNIRNIECEKLKNVSIFYLYDVFFLSKFRTPKGDEFLGNWKKEGNKIYIIISSNAVRELT